MSDIPREDGDELEIYSLPPYSKRAPLPGEATDYWGMLRALCESLARNAGITMDYTDEQKRVAKITLAEWTRGIHDTEAGRKVSASVERMLQDNQVADSLERLWAWYDDPNT